MVTGAAADRDEPTTLACMRIVAGCKTCPAELPAESPRRKAAMSVRAGGCGLLPWRHGRLRSGCDEPIVTIAAMRQHTAAIVIGIDKQR